MEQPGVLATLSRWRSRVQIPPGTLSENGTVRKPVKRPSSNLGDRLWVRFPPVPLRICVGWALACPSGCNPPAFGHVQVQLLPDALIRPVRLSVEDASLSRWKGGFDSRTGHSNLAKWWNWQTRDAQNVVPSRHGSSTLPLVTAEWTGVWFPARSHKPYDAGSNPASATASTGYFWYLVLIRAAGPTGRRRLCTPEMRVRFPRGPLTFCRCGSIEKGSGPVNRLMLVRIQPSALSLSWWCNGATSDSSKVWIPVRIRAGIISSSGCGGSHTTLRRSGIRFDS